MKFKFDKNNIEKKVEKILGFPLIYNGLKAFSSDPKVIMDRFTQSIKNENFDGGAQSINDPEFSNPYADAYLTFDGSSISITCLSPIKQNINGSGLWVSYEIFINGRRYRSVDNYIKNDCNTLRSIYEILCITICKM